MDAGEAPSSRLVRAGRLTLHARTAGRGRPVVLLHGWPTSSFLWRNVIPPLASRGRVLAPDLPGCGESDKPDGARYRLGDQAEALGAFIEAHGVGQVALVLHDLGGPIGLLWAVRNPHRVERIVVLNTALYRDGPLRLFWGEGPPWRQALALLRDRDIPPPARLALLAMRTPGLGRLLLGRGAVVRVMRRGVARTMPEAIAAAYARPFASPAGRRALARTFLDPRLEEVDEIALGLPRLAAPALVLYGARDRLLPGVRAEMARLARDLPDARLGELPGCGHFLQEDDPEGLSARLLDFLGDWLRA